MADLPKYKCNACGKELDTEWYAMSQHHTKHLTDDGVCRYGKNYYTRICSECFNKIKDAVNIQWED